MNEISVIIQKLAQENGNHVYIKREDLIPYSFGGNKVRKALKFFKELEDTHCDCVVTYGSSSSNHCRAVTNMAAAKGLDCHIISPQEQSKETFNSKMMKLFGAEITIVPVEEVHDTIENKLQRLERKGKRPFFIPGGGHGNLGTQAYVDCYQEIKKYELENHIYFDYIFFASGTGTTQAGLVCGQLMQGDNREIIGISIARKTPRGRQVVLNSIHEYLDSNNISIAADRIEAVTIFEDHYIGDGYATDNLGIRETICEMIVQYGIPMDLTYTGKAYAGMKEYLKENKITGKTILFIHTGGTPLFFDDLQRICAFGSGK
ncbi:1-aminocyclopropane-1-carboxylate deaminase/D-cysteine desulfhydrase [Zhenpiania hominis]|uniref:1-aminocyclopropane-1-carboxylate deaminase/D-cysteine desulfhydrase n=1 Tax=Zhenpiania hominis TaxID=2763644 RepID=UPI0039F45E3A